MKSEPSAIGTPKTAKNPSPTKWMVARMGGALSRSSVASSGVDDRPTARSIEPHAWFSRALPGARSALVAAERRRADLHTEIEAAGVRVGEVERRRAVLHDEIQSIRARSRQVDAELTPDDPMTEIRVRKPRQVPPVVLTYDELVRLLVAAVFTLGERVAWAILLVYLLGLRRKEARPTVGLIPTPPNRNISGCPS